MSTQSKDNVLFNMQYKYGYDDYRIARRGQRGLLSRAHLSFLIITPWAFCRRRQRLQARHTIKAVYSIHWLLLPAVIDAFHISSIKHCDRQYTIYHLRFEQEARARD